MTNEVVEFQIYRLRGAVQRLEVDIHLHGFNEDAVLCEVDFMEEVLRAMRKALNGDRDST